MISETNCSTRQPSVDTRIKHDGGTGIRRGLSNATVEISREVEQIKQETH